MSYRVIRDGVEIGVSTTIVHIFVGENGAYQECEQYRADGFCVKLPREIQTMDMETNKEIVSTQICDTVFSLPEHNLSGAYGEATFEEVKDEEGDTNDG